LIFKNASVRELPLAAAAIGDNRTQEPRLFTVTSHAPHVSITIVRGDVIL